ncbi:MAG: L-ribulose-5-phosphate 4-epimerase [Bacteroidales bacterium]|nr:L-ribulose-5-phosphate 4-epimerase [Bacteroidales bacterium]
MYEELKERVLKANLDLVKHSLVLFTWGNVSEIDREKGVFAIKPSGVPYDKLRAEDIVVLDMDGKVVDGKLRPSSDMPTHLVLFKAFPNIGGVAHTHSTYATAWAQTGKNIPCLGTTQADYFHGDVPCTADMTSSQIDGDYEIETGNVIVETFKGIEPTHVPGVLVKNHGPFTWGKNADEAVYHSVVLEEIAKMDSITLALNPAATIRPEIIEKHFMRKHGPNAYYGQK